MANTARESFATEPGKRWLREWANRPGWSETREEHEKFYSEAWFQIADVALSAIDEASDDDGFSLKRRYAAILGTLPVTD